MKSNNCKDGSFVDEPKAKDELVKALPDYKLTQFGKTLTDRTHCQFESIKKFDKTTFDKEARRIIEIVNKIKNKYDLPNTTYNIGMRNDGTIVAVVDIGQKYVEDSIKKVPTLVGLTKLIKVINKHNK